MRGRLSCMALLCSLCLLLIGCQKASIRNVLMNPDAGITQADQNADDGSLKEIHSFELTATAEGKNVQMSVWGWMNATHIWCQTYNDGSLELSAIDDSYGFIKKLGGTSHQMFLGTSLDGRYALFTTIETESKKSNDNVAPVRQKNLKLLLYDSQTEESTKILETDGMSMPRYQSLSFTPDGRYLSFLLEYYVPTGFSVSAVVYDMQTHSLREYVIENMIDEAGYPYLLQLTDVKSIDELSGWLFTYEKKFNGMGNARYMYLNDGKAYPAERKPMETGRIFNLAACKQLQISRGIQMKEMWGSNQSYRWFDNGVMVQTSDGKLLAIDLRTGAGQILADNVKGVVFSPNGARVAWYVLTKAGVEIYTARIRQDASQALVLENKRLAYTGRNANLGFWNQDGSKLVIYETEEKDNASYCRVLTFNTTQQ